MKIKIKQVVLTAALSLLACLQAPVISYALPFTRSGNHMFINGELYRENDVGGSKAFVPIMMARSGDNSQALSKLTTLPGAQTGFGSWASQAAFRYTGFSGYTGANSQYLVKTAAAKTIANEGTQWLEPPYYRYNSPDMLSFRYAGMVVTGRNAVAGTNPDFPSDMVTASSSGGAATNASVWKRDVTTGSVRSQEVTVYGNGGGVHQLSDVYTNGINGTSFHPGVGNVVSNKYSEANNFPDQAKKAFDKWLDSSDGYGEEYKKEAETWIQQTGSSLQWWEVLNQFFQINGDPDDPNATLYFYMVGGVQSGHTYYNTYATTGKILKNTSPTLLAITDRDTGEVLTESYRNASHMDPENGAGSETVGETAVLEPGKHYRLEGVMTYYSQTSGSSKTNRGADLYVIGTGATDAEHLSENMQPVNVVSPAINHKSPTDGKTGGTINASKNRSDGDPSYYYNGAAFNTITFRVTDDMPQAGYIIMAVPDAFGENGDNDVMNDDRIAIRYTTTTPPVGPEPQDTDAYGDLNLGMPEYRSLHYLKQEIPEPEEPEGGTPEEGGEPVEPPEPITYEYFSDYGNHKSPDGVSVDNRTENDTPQSPNGTDIWNAGSVDEAMGDGWWEYTERRWPDQSADIENKCWLLDENGKWDQDDQFLRSINRENPFGFGFRVSRSRGDLGSVLSSATVDVQIYGVSPDTGEDGELLAEYTDGGRGYKSIKTGSLGVYDYSDANLNGVVSSEEANGIEDFPRIRVVAKISEDVHGESGIFGSGYKYPAQNGWEEEHDTVERVFEAEMDDMRIVEVELKDSEGIVVFHADRYDSDNMEVEVNGYYDKEEDLFMKVVVEQHVESGHRVKDPAIDVSIRGLNEDGAEESTYVDSTFTLEGTELGRGQLAVYDGIAFRPRAADKLRIHVQINEKHGADMWRENIWDNDDDAYGVTLEGTTADLAVSQDIELYNSKNNPQSFLTFAEYLSFRYDIKHIGRTNRQMAIVGGSAINPYAKLDVAIYNADALTTDPYSHNLVYRMASQDPKAAVALIRTGEAEAATRLFPGLGSNGFSSHVQAWLKNYIVQSYVTDTGNVAAYGHILVTGNVNSFHDSNNTNIRDNATDYVQKEFFGEKNFKIVDIGVTSRNPISSETGIAVQAAIQNMPSSYNDQTVVDKTYVDVYIDDELKKTVQVEVPVGDTIVTEIIIEEIELEECEIVEVRVNTGKHQTHYEYVLQSTDSSLYPDPFVDNYMSIVICPNKPNETVCPLCIIDDNVDVDNIFGDNGGGEEPEVPDHNNVTDTSKYTVQFEANDGSATNKTQSIGYNSTAALAANTFRNSGYSFDGWNTKPDGSGTSYEDKAVLTVGSKQSYGSETTLILYAQWKPVGYTISFNANGGTGNMAPIECVFDVAKSLPFNTFEKTGSMFKSWNTQADGSGISVEDGGSVKNFTDIEGKEVILYAQWTDEADCVILENFVASSAIDLEPGDMIAENPSLLSMVDYSTYGYMKVKIPVVSATKAGDVTEKIYDLFTPDWNTADWTLVYEEHATVEGEQSVYVFRYQEVLAPDGTELMNPNSTSRKANRTTDLYSRLKVGDFTSLGTVHVSTELQGLVYATPPGGTITPEEMEITDQIALQLLGVTL